MSCKICLSDMCSGGCCNVDYKTLQDISYGLKLRIAELGNNYELRLKEGYSCSPSDFDFQIGSSNRDSISKNGRLLLEYKEVLNLKSVIDQKIKDIYNGAESCLCEKSLCKVKDKAIEIIGVSCYDDCRMDIQVDSSLEEAWINANPYCISKENWEKLLYKVCTDMQVDIAVVKKSCDLVYDIVREYRNCSLDFNIESETLNCEIEFETIKRVNNCEITYQLYRSLRECGISYDLIRRALECGINFDIDLKDKCPMIVTLKDTFRLCDDNYDGERLTDLIYTYSIK